MTVPLARAGARPAVSPPAARRRLTRAVPDGGCHHDAVAAAHFGVFRQRNSGFRISPSSAGGSAGRLGA